jgi:peroxiredoxin
MIVFIAVLLVAMAHASRAAVALSAEAAAPLAAGDPVPEVTLSALDGSKVPLAELYEDQPVALVFFRGGWCPYCTRHLGAIGEVLPELDALGFQVIGISPDTAESLAEGTAEADDRILVLQDESFEAIEAFGLAFALDEPTLEKLDGYGITVRNRPSDEAAILPVPAVYLVDTEGMIRFSHYDPNYRKRLAPGSLLDAAEKFESDKVDS